jgi:hypothetical protein
MVLVVWLKFGIVLVLVVLFCLMAFVFAVDSRCPDYCSRGTYYSNGVYSSRSFSCSYSSTVCVNGCDSRGVACLPSSTRSASTTNSSTAASTGTSATSTPAANASTAGTSTTNTSIGANAASSSSTSTNVTSSTASGASSSTSSQTNLVSNSGVTSPTSSVSESNPQPSPSPTNLVSESNPQPSPSPASKVSESNPQPSPSPSSKVSESNPQPSPSPSSLGSKINPASSIVSSCHPPECQDFSSGEKAIEELMNKSGTYNPSMPASFSFGKNVSALDNVKAIKSKNVVVEAFNAIKSYVKGALIFWPDFTGAEFYGSEVLLENHNRKELLDLKNLEEESTGDLFTDFQEDMEMNEYNAMFEDLFTFYLPGGVCDLVVDTCVPFTAPEYSTGTYFVGARPFLDELPATGYWQQKVTGWPFSKTIDTGKCPSGFASCGGYKYLFTPNSELKKQGMPYCEYEFGSPLEGNDPLVGEICGNDKFAKTIEPGDGTTTLLGWECGVINESGGGKPMCCWSQQLDTKLQPVLTSTLSMVNRCKSFKAEDLEGGFHFITLKGNFSYLRYTYACKKKGLFG